MDIIRRALAAPPRRRQAETTGSETSASSSAAAAATTGSTAASTQKGTAAAKTKADAAATTSSPSLSGAVASTAEGPNGPTTIFHIATPPQFTATSKEAYIAPGVNATHPFTSTPPPTAAATTATATSSTSTTSHYVDPAEEAKASAKAFGIPKNELTRCEINGTEPDNGPFCTPKHLQNIWVGFTYAMTWNSDLFAENATNTMQLVYNDTSLGTVWTSPAVPNYQGYVNVEFSKDWLKGASGNNSDLGQNMTLNMISKPLDAPEQNATGPQVALVIDPHKLPRVKIPHISNKYGLEIGLPVGLVALAFIVLAIFCGIRKNSKHHRSVRGVTKDYMAKRSRRRGLGSGGDIALGEYGGDNVGQYTDQPLKGGGGGSGNAFRDEVARQRQEDEASLKRYPTSY